MKVLSKIFLAAMVSMPMFVQSNLANAVEISKPKAVVELFTSQGCHACPPADKTFVQVVKDPDILGLAFHVDYWDRLGWKDTFGSEENTLRQYNYAWAMNLRSAYTPQAVVNGREQIIGTKDQLIKEAAARLDASQNGLVTPIHVAKGEDDITIKIDANSANNGSVVYAVYFDDLSTVEVKGGANRGKVIDYVNIVKEVEIIGQLDGSAYEMTLPNVHFQSKGHENMAIILQSTQDGLINTIDGAVVISDFKSS